MNILKFHTLKDGYSFNKCQKIELYYAFHAAFVPLFTLKRPFRPTYRRAKSSNPVVTRWIAHVFLEKKCFKYHFASVSIFRISFEQIWMLFIQKCLLRICLVVMVETIFNVVNFYLLFSLQSSVGKKAFILLWIVWNSR